MTQPHFPLTCSSLGLLHEPTPHRAPLCPNAPYALLHPTTPHYTPACLATRSQQSKPPGTEGDPTEVQSEHFKALGQTMETENVFLLTSI